MADRGPNYTVERRRLELAKMEHNQTIQKQTMRLEEIDSQKNMNLARAELANMELDDEAEKIKVNQQALKSKITEIDKNLDLMTKAE
jgi:Neuraminidase (sialidase)